MQMVSLRPIAVLFSFLLVSTEAGSQPHLCSLTQSSTPLLSLQQTEMDSFPSTSVMFLLLPTLTVVGTRLLL
ncbi:uncharacterized protein RJT20DRAFT_123593 [Scheffersomyces xylosifermentans]|uniref:uncharacterized protein n=1 Tax=Scheffersomyces xylosifermentans TaxID=1304137 RepID=UPI00315DA921